MEDEDEEELVERLECEIEMEKGRWKCRKVSGEIRMGDRWMGYKRRKKWAWEGICGRKNFECLRGFWEIEEKFERKKLPKERENYEKKMGV